MDMPELFNSLYPIFFGSVKSLPDEGSDISYIHYTGVADRYAKLGYKTFAKWNRNGLTEVSAAL